MPTLIHLLAVVVLAISPAIFFASDLEDLQGDWETSFQQDGKVYRAVKTIKGQTETVEVYDGERLMKRHSVDFELNERDGIRTFAYRNGQITFGAGSPAKLPDGKYIYRIDGDKWIGVFGAFSNDSQPKSNSLFEKPSRQMEFRSSVRPVCRMLQGIASLGRLSASQVGGDCWGNRSLCEGLVRGC